MKRVIYSGAIWFLGAMGTLLIGKTLEGVAMIDLIKALTVDVWFVWAGFVCMLVYLFVDFQVRLYRHYKEGKERINDFQITLESMKANMDKHYSKHGQST